MIATLYLNRILSGKQTFQDVPAKLREQVAQLMIEHNRQDLLTKDYLNKEETK